MNQFVLSLREPGASRESVQITHADRWVKIPQQAITPCYGKTVVMNTEWSDGSYLALLIPAGPILNKHGNY